MTAVIKSIVHLIKVSRYIVGGKPLRLIRLLLVALLFQSLAYPLPSSIKIAVLTPAALGILKSIGAENKIVIDLSKSFGAPISSEVILKSGANFIYGASYMHEYLLKSSDKSAKREKNSTTLKNGDTTNSNKKNYKEGDLPTFIMDPKVHIYLSNPVSVKAVIDEITYIGELADCVNGAKAVVKSIKSAITECKAHPLVKNKVAADTFNAANKGNSAPTVAMFISSSPLIAVGGETFLSDMINVCGAVNVFSDIKGFPTISDELLLTRPPDVFIKETDYDNDLLLQPGARVGDALKTLYTIIKSHL